MNNTYKSIFAGILIGIGCNIYNICPNRIVGAGLGWLFNGAESLHR